MVLGGVATVLGDAGPCTLLHAGRPRAPISSDAEVAFPATGKKIHDLVVKGFAVIRGQL